MAIDSNLSHLPHIDRKLVEIGYFEEIAAGWAGGGKGGANEL